MTEGSQPPSPGLTRAPVDDGCDCRTLKREVRVLNAKLKRSATNQRRLEGHRNTAIDVHRSIIAEMEAAQRESVEAQERAAAANAAKSRFLANMSHELRTPLTAIIGFSELLAEEPAISEDEVIGDDVDAILGSARHLLTLIDTLLDLSKVEAGKVELYTEEFHLPRFLEEVCSGIEPVVGRQNNQLKLVVDPRLGRVAGDRTRVRQILSNLLANSAKFTTDGVIGLCATWENGAIRFEVSDTGCGMNSQELSRVFEPFTQASAGVASRHGGTGLGLTLVREFVHLMGGTVSVESSKDVGTTFAVVIPLTHIPTSQTTSMVCMSQEAPGC